MVNNIIILDGTFQKGVKYFYNILKKWFYKFYNNDAMWSNIAFRTVLSRHLVVEHFTVDIWLSSNVVEHLFVCQVNR